MLAIYALFKAAPEYSALGMHLRTLVIKGKYLSTAQDLVRSSSGESIKIPLRSPVEQSSISKIGRIGEGLLPKVPYVFA